MEKSLDELIEFLLGEIAVCGAKGASLLQLTGLVKTFYNDARQESSVPDVPSPSIPPAGFESTRQYIDQSFISKVWKWLGQQPDISIGQKKHFNKTSLLQFWPKSDGADSTLHKSSDEAPRIFVNEDRIYQAICGHPPDASRVFPKEFALLSQIAASGRDGILQGDLGRATGQDKRSVPKRTDALRDKGYIIKETVYTKGMKTSRLTLRRYIPDQGGSDVKIPASDDLQESNAHQTPRTRDLVDNIVSLFTDDAKLEFDQVAILTEMTDDAEKKALTKIIRTMERCGCVKRVRMALAPDAQSKDVKTYIQLLRRPADSDSEFFDKSSLPFDRPLAELIHDEAAKLSHSSPSSPTSAASPAPRSKSPEQGSIVAQWNPDRCVANMLSDATRMAGTSGLSNVNARNLVTGPFIRRTLESLLTRLSYQGLLSQPGHLRHLAIVRTMKLVEGSLEYAHFTQRTLLEVVGDKRIQFSSIPGSKELRASGTSSKAKADDYDEFGFQRIPASLFWPQEGAAGLTELIQATDACDLLPRGGEPRILTDDQGQDVLEKSDTLELAPKVRTPRKKPPPVDIQETGEKADKAKRQGRPRKFLRGTEKFWQHHFRQARIDAHRIDDKLPLRHGTMNDPTGLALFRGRPKHFDETVVEARSAGLPLPASAEDVSDEWIHRTRKVLDRADDGAYVSPVGMFLGRTKYRSQMLIVRSERLSTLDFSDKKQAPRFRFISSSVAHSFANLRFLAETMREEAAPKQTRKPRHSSRLVHKKKEAVKAGPRLGIFVETAITTAFTPPNNSPVQRRPLPLSAAEYQQVMDDTESDSNVQTGHIAGSQTVSRRDSRASLATSVISAPPPEPKPRSQSTNLSESKACIGQAVRSRPSRRRKLTQKAADSLQDGNAEINFAYSTADTASTSSATDLTSLNLALELERRNDLDVGGAQGRPYLEDTVDRGDFLAASRTLSDDDETRIPTRGLSSTPTAPDTPLENQHHTPALTQIDEEESHETSIDTGTPNFLPRWPSRVEQPSPPRTADTVSGHVERDMITGQPTSNDNKENEQPHSDAESLPPTSLKQSRSRKRQLSDLDPDNEAAAPATPKRQKPVRESHKDRSKLCRKILVDLIMLASGAAPCDVPTFKRVMVNRWQAEGGHDRPDRKLVMNNLKVISDSGKLQRIGFSFRSKGGIVQKKSILAHRSIDPTAQVIQDLKRKMIEADTTEYVPPVWQAETLPELNASGRKRKAEEELERPPIQKIPHLFQNDYESSSGDQDEPLTAETLQPKRKGQKKTANTVESVRSSRQRRESQASSRASSTSELEAQSHDVELTTTAAFLTLKVPRLGELPQVHIFNADLKDPEWMRKPKDQTRISRDPTLPQTRKRKGGFRRKPPLPQTLSAIIATQERHDPLSKIELTAEEKDQAFKEYDAISAWELRCEEEILGTVVNRAFINHTPPTVHRVTGPVAYWLCVEVDAERIVTERPNFETESWPPFVAAIQEAAVEDSPSPTVSLQTEEVSASSAPRMVTRERTGTRRKRKLSLTPEEILPAVVAKKPRRRNAQRSRRKSVISIQTTSSSEVAPNTEEVQKQARRTRASTLVRKMSQEQLYQITITIICVATLIGGIEKQIDWTIVRSVLPNQESLEDCWEIIVDDFERDIRSLTETLQEKYIDALELGDVPTVNLDDVHAMDWKGIVSWAAQNLDSDVFGKKALQLPATRSELLDKHKVNLQNTQSIRTAFQPTIKNQKPPFEELNRSTVFGDPLRQVATTGNLSDGTGTLPRLRSFLLSTILCPDARYSQPLGAAKWQSLAATENEREILARAAFESLHKDGDKLIALRPNPDKIHGPRKYRVTTKFYDQFGDKNCLITAAMLRGAAKYKVEVLDEVFASGEKLELPKNARLGAGEMLAITQLLGMGAIEVRPGADVPSSRYGVDWQHVGHQNRTPDKEQFGFGVVVGRKEGYVYGDVIGKGKGKSVDVPRGDINRADSTPIWVDVRGEVVFEVWEMVLGSVMGIMSMRPGVNAEEISKSLGSAVGAWEVELLLDWSEKIGFVKKTPSRNGWETREWWWLCLAQRSIDEL